MAQNQNSSLLDMQEFMSAKTLLKRELSRELPRLHAPCALSEVLVESAEDGAASAFAWALACGSKSERPLLVWLQDRLCALEAGRPYVPGLASHAGLEQRFVLIEAKASQDMLWAMEEALLSGAVSCVIGEIWGEPKCLTFTATKRLQRAAQMGKTPCLLLRYGRGRAASGAHERWSVHSQPSAPHSDDPAAPGPPGWSLDLFKARTRQPATWTTHYDQETHRLHLAAPLGDGPVRQTA